MEIIPYFAGAVVVVVLLLWIDKIDWRNPAVTIPFANFCALFLAFIVVFYTDLIVKKPVIIGWHGISASIQDFLDRLECFFIYFIAQGILVVLVYFFIPKDEEEIRTGLQICIMIYILLIYFGFLFFGLS